MGCLILIEKVNIYNSDNIRSLDAGLPVKRSIRNHVDLSRTSGDQVSLILLICIQNTEVEEEYDLKINLCFVNCHSAASNNLGRQLGKKCL